MSNLINIAVVQHACTTDGHANLNNNILGIKQAVERGADIVLLPELGALPYFCLTVDVKNYALSEPLDGNTFKVLQRVARKYSVVIVATIFEKRTLGVYHNTAIVIDKDGSLAGIYRKMHIPDDPGFYEKYYFTPGEQGFIPIETSVGKLGVLICWDQWFPEAARIMALSGAEILLYPSAIAWDAHTITTEKDKEIEAWKIMQQSHAIANNLPVVVSNRIGLEQYMRHADPMAVVFWGSSFIIDTQGKILAQASTDKPMVLNAQINLQDIETTRQVWPYLRDRRVEHYHSLTQRYIDT